jgi:hypothetical protein
VVVRPAHPWRWERVFVHHHVPCFVLETLPCEWHAVPRTFRTAHRPRRVGGALPRAQANARADVLPLPAGVSDTAATTHRAPGVRRALRRPPPGRARGSPCRRRDLGLLYVQAALALGAEAGWP